MVSKRGAELPMNVIVIAVIALIVLILVAGFFMGGTRVLFERMGGIFKSGYDERSFVLQTCETRCNVATELPRASWVGSSYCKGFFYMDDDGDGKVDLDDIPEKAEKGVKKKYYCYDGSILGAPPCLGVRDACVTVVSNID